MKSLMPYVIVFVLLIVAAIYLGNADPITGAVAEARAEASTGSVKLDVINEGVALLFHIVTGGIIVTALGWALLNANKLANLWFLKQRTNRNWKPGPNANFQKTAQVPKLTREDIIMMALANSGRLPNMRPKRNRSMNQQEESDEIDIEL